MRNRSLEVLVLMVGLCGACAKESLNADGGSDGMAQPAGLGMWRGGPSLSQESTEVVAVMARGKIFVIGGLNGGGSSDRVDIYDPQTGRWSSGPPLPPQAPRHHLAAAAFDDRIYVLGGYVGSTFNPTNQTWVLDGSWSQRASQPLTRGAATAQAVGDRIYVVGGASNATVYPDLYSYDPKRDIWEPRQPMRTAREHLASCAVQGLLLVAGGRVSTGNLAAAEMYQPSTDEWTTLPDLPTARGGIGGATLGSVCYILGGERDGPPPNTFAQNEGFDLPSGAWRAYAALPTARHGLGVTALGGSIYAIAGGKNAGFFYSDVMEVFSP